MGDDGRTTMQRFAETESTNRPRAGTTRRKHVVLADDGASVALVLLEATRTAAIGERFTHRGRRWEICGTRHGSRVFVAEPADRQRQ